MSAVLIQFTNAAKTYDGVTYAVKDLSLEVAEGEFLILIGESGCGKTTSLKMINRLVDPDEGSVTVDGQDVTRVDPVKLRRGIGYVFQGIGLFPHLTVAENVGMVMRLQGEDRGEISVRVDELLELVGLNPVEFRDRPPGELSGGQQQRIGVARALSAKPKVMLMDEPFGALDPITRDSLREEFIKLQDKLNLTVVMVTHDMTEALLLGDRIAVLEEGKLVRIGTPHELMTNPDHPYVEALLSNPKHQADRLKDLLDRGEES